MTHEEIVTRYTDTITTYGLDTPTSTVEFTKNETPVRRAVLVVLDGQLFWMAENIDADAIFPAFGPLKSFDHAHAVITMRGYTLDG